jgi:hypothetical protein
LAEGRTKEVEEIAMQQYIYIAEKLKELDRMPRHIITSARCLAGNDLHRPHSQLLAAARRAGDAIAAWIWPCPPETLGDECGR